MRAALRRVLDEDWIVILGSGIALGYTVLNVAEALGFTVVTALESQPDESSLVSDSLLTFSVGDHPIVLGQLVQSLIAFAVVVGIVAFVVSRLKAPENAAP
jgi:D-arabinose 1-dehydrogenase-like Zn-dependent alcohol dehydrogenase